MKYEAFKRVVAMKGWTIVDLRCEEASPSEELLEVMDRCGLEKYERFVLKLEAEPKYAKHVVMGRDGNLVQVAIPMR